MTAKCEVRLYALFKPRKSYPFYFTNLKLCKYVLVQIRALDSILNLTQWFSNFFRFANSQLSQKILTIFRFCIEIALPIFMHSQNYLYEQNCLFWVITHEMETTGSRVISIVIFYLSRFPIRPLLFLLFGIILFTSFGFPRVLFPIRLSPAKSASLFPS